MFNKLNLLTQKQNIMQKFLRTFAMAALLLMPFAMQAQDCTTAVTVTSSSAFTEGFESGSMPSCWTTDGSGTWSVATGDYSTSTGAHTGTYNAKITHGTTGNATKLITPLLDLTGLTSAQLNFWYVNRSWAGDIDELHVYYRTSTSGTWTELQSFTAGTTTWTECTITLPGASATYQVAFEMVDSYGYGVGIDDVTIGDAPSCLSVTGLTATSTANSITLSWTDAQNTGATYSVIGSDGSVITSGLTTTTYTVTGLTANTAYTFGVVANCSATDAADAVIINTRTACEANTVFPWSDDFESYTASSSGVTLDAPCWVNEHISGSGTYFFEVYQSTSATGDNATKMLRLHDMSSGTMTKLMLPPMDIPAGSTYQFVIDVYRNASGTSSTSEGVRVYASTDGEITGATELGFLYRNYTQTDNGVVGAETASGWYTYEFTIPFTGTCYIILRGESQYGSATYMDNFIIREAPSCLPVSALTINSAATTSTSLTLTWADALNTSATYSVYDMSDTSIVTSGLTATTYTVTGLTANTSYTFGVVADCGGGDLAEIRTVSGRTACAAASLPYTCGFEANEIQSTTQATALPWCSQRYVTPGATSGTSYPYSYASYAHNGSRSLYFYGTTSTSYPAQMALILPEVDVTSYPMNGNRISFWAKMSSTSYNKDVIVATLSDPTDITTLTAIDTVQVTGTTHTKYTVSLASATPTDAYVVLIVNRGSGSLYLDDLTLEEMPACLEVTGVTSSDITTSSVTLSWTDADNPAGTTYSVYDMSDTSLVASALTSTTYTVTGLNHSTAYVFGVRANCTAGDAPYTTIAVRTACGVETMPWSENFDSWTAKSPCWSFLSGAYNMGAGTPTTTTSGWALQTTYGDYITISGKALAFNLYSTNRYWAVTPSIEMTGDAMFSVDVAVAAWSAATPNYDADDTLAIAISNNNGTTWTNLRVLNNTELNALSGTYTTINVSVNGYTGDTVRFAVFGGSSASGGDNRIAIDNFSVTEMSANFCYPVTNVVVDSVTATSVFLSWADTNNTGATYSVYSLTTTDTTFIADGISVTNYEVTNLTASTNYTFAVVTNCSATDSSTMVTVGARTDCAGGSCNITINGVDAYSDGWNGASITISQNAETVGTFTLTTGASYSETFQVCSGAPVTFTWNSGDYDDEASFQILDGGNNVAYTCTDGSDLTDGAVFTTIADPCPSCVAPVLTVDAATTTSVTISWTGNAASYSVYLDSVFVANVTTNTYTFTGLTAATIYNFGVASICSATDSSSIATIAANTACNTFAIPFVENFEPEGNEVCWTIHATSTGTTFTTGSGNYVVNGTGLFAFFYSENPPQYLISPELTGTGNGVEMSFSYRVYSATYPESFMVGYSTTTNDTSAFVWSTEQTNLANTTYDRYVENLTAAGIKYVAIKYTANDMYALLIDSLVVRDIPTCDPVTALTASNVTNNSVTLNWTGTAASYDVYNGTTMVANVTTNTYTFTGLTAATAYTFGVQALCSATDSADMVTVAVSTACDDITTLPYNEGFEDGLGCWTSVNGSADGVDWNAQPAFSSGSITPHTGNYMAASWSWNSNSMHANAWLISPKFVLPTVNAGDSLTFSWWARTNHSYPDSYSVVLSNTTSDTAAFTNVIRPYAMADTNDTWVLHTVDLSAYAGQSVYIAFHHVDYDNNYLLIDDIALSQGGYVPPAPDTMTVTFAVNDATMGTTNPAPGTYQYLSGDTVRFEAIATTGHVFTGWNLTIGTQTLTSSSISVYFEVNTMLRYGNTVTVTANFEPGTPDSTTITYAVNDPTLGTTNPAPGTYTIYVGDSITASATAYTGSVLAAWVMDIIVDSAVYSSDTLYSDDPEFTNPWYVGRLPQNFVNAGASIVITAIFEDEDPGTTYYTITGVANDPDMGYVLGSNRYAAGSEVVLTAVANNGYRFVRWSNGETTATITFTATENVELTAFFEVDNTGIEDANMANVSIYSTDNKIVVRGAEGQSIYVFDLNGRVMASENNAAESVEFRMQTTGVYLVKVGTAAAKRVVLMR